LRVVIRESMGMDLLDHLITDICVTTEALMKMDDFDLATWHPFPSKTSSSHGTDSSGHRMSVTEMDGGIHRSVC
jgi:glutamate decarboxylase